MSYREDTTKGDAQDMLPSTSASTPSTASYNSSIFDTPDSQKAPGTPSSGQGIRKRKLKVSDLNNLPTIECKEHPCQGLTALDIGAILDGSNAEFQEAEWGRLMNETNFLIMKWDEGWADLAGDWDNEHRDDLG